MSNGSLLSKKAIAKMISDAIELKVSGTTTLTAVYASKVRLLGTNPTPVSMGAHTAASITGSVTAPFELDDGLTFVVTTDGNEEDVAFAGTAGVHTGAAGAATDLTGEIDTQFKIQVDNDPAGAKTVTCDWTGCDSGIAIAAQMESKIRELDGVYGAVTVEFSSDKYVITSGTIGSGSKVRITIADMLDVCDELKIGPNHGANTDGTGDALNLYAATITEVLTKLAGLGSLVATQAAGAVVLTSKTSGSLSTLVIGDGTANDALGFVFEDANSGVTGMGTAYGMLTANYYVTATLNGVAEGEIPGKAISITNRTTSGFDIECEDSSSTDLVDVLVFGKAATS